ncbi:MAG: hypothetical protein HZA22_00330 [Nitrospirae bacterium]|nr:hypothetical protein [Nitrospirota bacterium]MBI5694403.1 hypothetical protein [Nitrospirota bacterium]
MEQKKWYTSKTLWANTVATIAIVLQGTTGKELLPVEFQGVLLGVVNMALRLITKSEVVW